MSECRDEVKEIAVETPVGKLAAKGVRVSDLMALGMAACIAVLIYMMWEHRAEAKEGTVQMASAIDKLARAQLAATQAQRELTCIIAMPQDKRESEFNSPLGLCKRVSAQ